MLKPVLRRVAAGGVADMLEKMTPQERVKAMIKGIEGELKEALQGRGNLSEDDLGYLVSKVATLKDERLKQCIAELIGWGDEQRSRLETSSAILLEVAKGAGPTAFRKAAMKVEMRYHLRSIDG